MARSSIARLQRKQAERVGRHPGEWRSIEVTESMRRQHPHLEHCAYMWANNRIEVQAFPCKSPIGGIMQVTIARHLNVGEDLTWREIQTAVHELFGDKVFAVECYPPRDQEWNPQVNVRVLWIFPGGYDVPFGLHRSEAWGREG